MKRSLRSPTGFVVTLAVILVAVLDSGCAKKFAVDRLGDLLVPAPEGTRGTLDRTPSDLVVWPDVPQPVKNIVFDASGAIVTTYYNAYRTGPGASQGAILDYVQADAYEVFRGEGMHDSAGVAVRGGYRRFDDFALSPFRRWADRDYYAGPGGTVALPPAQLFFFSDAVPSADSLKVYVGRAVVTGLSSRDHPLTNRGQTPGSGAIAPLVYTGSRAPFDSLIDLSWQPVPGAAGYWAHLHTIFQRRKEKDLAGDDAVAIGLPSPVARGGDRVMVRDLFIGYFPASVTSYKLGDPLPAGSRVLVYRVLPALQEVRVRVSAVDAMGRMIASIGANGDSSTFAEPDGSRIRTFPIGAVVVTPGRGIPPSPSGPSAARAPGARSRTFR